MPTPPPDEVFCCIFGQYPTEFGMLPGPAVNFELDQAGDVAWVELLLARYP